MWQTLSYSGRNWNDTDLTIIFSLFGLPSTIFSYSMSLEFSWFMFIIQKQARVLVPNHHTAAQPGFTVCFHICGQLS